MKRKALVSILLTATVAASCLSGCKGSSGDSDSTPSSSDNVDAGESKSEESEGNGADCPKTRNSLI